MHGWVHAWVGTCMGGLAHAWVGTCMGGHMHGWVGTCISAGEKLSATSDNVSDVGQSNV